MSDIVKANLSGQVEYARTLAGSALLPKQYQQNPANILYAVSYAEALGVHPMTAVTGIHVIDGKPTASAQLIGALVRRAGHRLRVTGDADRAVAVIVRADDPEFEFRCEWTLDRARAAGLTNKSVWRQYPAAMLKARAITEVAREACAEALYGVIYTPEELGAEVTLTEAWEFEPVPAAEARDWFTDLEAFTDPSQFEELRAFYSHAEDCLAGPQVLAAIRARGVELKARLEEDVVEAEVIEDPVSEYIPETAG